MNTKNKKQKILKMVGALAAVFVVYFVYDFFFYVSTDNAQIQANTVVLTARVSGFVMKVNVEEGQKVKAGDVLVEIDAKDYQRGRLCSSACSRRRDGLPTDSKTI